MPEKSKNGFSIPVSSCELVKNDIESRRFILQKLGYDFFDFEFHEAYLILEESTVERLITEILIPTFVPGLRHRLKTIGALGVGDLEPRFSSYHTLFVYLHTDPKYHKKAWVIADGDTAGKEVISKLKDKFKSINSEHFLNFERENFEDYFPKKFDSKVANIKSLKSGKQKQELKRDVLNELLDYCNKEKPIDEFEKCFNEHITFLKGIEEQLDLQ